MKIVYYLKNLINNKFIYLDDMEEDDILNAYPFDSEEDCVSYLNNIDWGYYEIIKVVKIVD